MAVRMPPPKANRYGPALVARAEDPLMATDVARAQAAESRRIALMYLRMTIGRLKRVHDALADPEHRRVVVKVLARLEDLSSDLAIDLALDPGHGEVDQVTSFGDPS